jgi:hypothetical protein
MENTLGNIETIRVSPSLINAYLIELSKALLIIGSVVGAYFLVRYLAGEDPFVGILDTLGIPVVWAIRALIALACLLLVAVFFSTLSLTSYSLFFEGDSLTYSYGSFFKATNTTKIANITSVNFKPHSVLKLGDVVVELSGTEVKSVTVQYVAKAKDVSELINKLVIFKKSQQVEEINQKGVV